MKFLKVGRVAIITHGRYAGKKVRSDHEHDCTLPRAPNRQARIASASGSLGEKKEEHSTLSWTRQTHVEKEKAWEKRNAIGLIGSAAGGDHPARRQWQ